MKYRKDKCPVVLMVDDDDEDIYLTRRAFLAAHSNIVFNSVADNSELFAYLNREGAYEHLSAASQPDVILLDINIPKTGGMDILYNLRSNDQFSYLPVVMLTTASTGFDVRRAYKLGANSYITKPASIDGMQKLAQQFCQYWFSVTQLPDAERI